MLSWVLSTAYNKITSHTNRLITQYSGYNQDSILEFNNNNNNNIPNIPIADDNPQNPYMKMKGTGGAHMHNSCYNLNVSDFTSTLHNCNKIKLISRSSSKLGIGGQCVGTYFIGNTPITLCAFFGKFQLQALDHELNIIATYDLPGRKGDFINAITLNFYALDHNTSGGSYFYLNEQEHIVIGSSDDIVREIAFDSERRRFRLVRRIDLSKYMGDIVSLLPTYNGNLWVIDTSGKVAIWSLEKDKLEAIIDIGEPIENSFALSDTMVYILTQDHLYAYNSDTYEEIWKSGYQRVNYVKPGAMSKGSGSSPTILKDYVVITDNCEYQINCNFYDRNNGELKYSIPVPFPPYHSANECSVVGVSDTQVIIVNTFGYSSFGTVNAMGDRPTPGVCMINLELSTKIQWISQECPSTSLPLVDASKQFLYLYTMDLEDSKDEVSFSITILSTTEGKLIRKIKLGSEVGFDNHWSPIHLGPDNTCYSGTLNGILKLIPVN